MRPIAKRRWNQVGLALAAALGLGTAARAATILVEETAPGVGAVVVAADTFCSLREAIINANANAATHADCDAGSGADTIVLPAGAVFTLPDASVLDPGGFGNTGLPHVTSEITLQGNGATIERDAGLVCDLNSTLANSEFRLLFVAPGASLTVEDATLRNGCANGDGGPAIFGGGILASDALLITVRRTTLRGNQAALGGALFAGRFSTVLIEASTFAANHANGTGGGIDWRGSGTVRNSTFSGNSAGEGGGLRVDPHQSVTLEHVTFAGNTASLQGGGIFNDDGTVNAKNVILSGSSCEESSSPTWSAQGANLDSGTSCATFFGSSFTANATTGLGPLADNGGPTETHALLAGSEAIDAATDCTPFGGGASIATDQRGVARPLDGDGVGGAVCDIGAYELNGLSLLEVPALGPWGLGLFALALAVAGLAATRLRG